MKMIARLALLAILATAAAAPIAVANDWPLPACWPNCLDR